MNKKHFDPFDERHRDRRERRKPEDVSAEQRDWNERVDNHLRRALDILEWPDYTDSEMVLCLCEQEMNLPIRVLRRNFRASMDRLGYEKFTSESNKRGRWKIGATWTVVYFKRGTARIERSELKQALGR